MAVDATSFCLAVLARSADPVGIRELVQEASVCGMERKDYELRRALRDLVSREYVLAEYARTSPSLLYSLTPRGRKAAKRDRTIIRRVLGIKAKAVNDPAESKAKPTIALPEPCTACGNFGHKIEDCTLGT